MSIYSGKCDLCDHIAGLGGWYDRDGNPVKFGEGCGAYYSDEYRDFLVFKQRTGGVLHQHKLIKVTEYNQAFVAEHCEYFSFVKVIEQTTDKRSRTGIKEKVSYTYKYWDKEYTLKELNKHGVYITIDIHFNTILDLIPYYPYIVTSCCSSNGKETVYISNSSYVDKQRDSLLEGGYDSLMYEHFKKDLQNHYRDIVLRYFNPEGREEIETVTFDENRQAIVNNAIDENFELAWFFEDGNKKHYWTNPEIVDAEKGIIEISANDYYVHIGKQADIYYVRKTEYPVYLG